MVYRLLSRLLFGAYMAYEFLLLLFCAKHPSFHLLKPNKSSLTKRRCHGISTEASLFEDIKKKTLNFKAKHFHLNQ